MSEIPDGDDEDYRMWRGHMIQIHYMTERLDVVVKGARLPSESISEARDRILEKYLSMLHPEDAAKNARLQGTESQGFIPSPPSSGQFILSLVAPLEKQEEVLGDLCERYVIQTGRFGLKRAKIWYWWCVARLVVTFTCKGIIGLVGISDLIDRFRSS